MNFIDDIRRENLAALAEEVGGAAVLSRRLDREESQVSQWIRGAKHSVTGKRRGMKSETARWIETTTGKPLGWLDIQHEAAEEKKHRCETPILSQYGSDRPLVRRLYALAEQVNDDGLRTLTEMAQCFIVTHPHLKKDARAA